MDFINLLFKYIIIGVVITTGVNQLVSIIRCKWNLQKYSLIFAFILSGLLIFAFNQGILTTLDIPIQDITHITFFHYVDLFITTLIVSGGAQLVHKMIEGFNTYKEQKNIGKTI